METFVKVADDFDSGDVAIISHGRATGGIPHLEKHRYGPLLTDWRGCHCWKKYRLENYTLKELGEAANDAYLIEGILNSKNPPCEVLEHNKHIPCGSEMNFVDGKQVSHGFVPILSVLL